jgi:hypothetical protein
MTTAQDIFIARTLVQGTIWSLKGADEDWAVCEFNDGEFHAMLLWPEEKGAKACAVGEWAGYAPTEIDLKNYIESWLPAMKEDGVKINIGFGPRSRGSVIEPDDLAAAYRAAQAVRSRGAS